MKSHLAQLIHQAIARLQAEHVLPANAEPDIEIQDARDKAHGDYATNTALKLAKIAGKPPRELAQLLVEALPESARLDKVEIAGPGFINFFMHADAATAVVGQILEQGKTFGRGRQGQDQRVMLEFVSANPTGPLHVGHGRGAAFGGALANLLEAAGYQVHREYYVNDAGRQMDILAASVWLRYLERCGETLRFPDNGYKGEYVHLIAADLHREAGDAYRHPAAAVMADLPADAEQGGDKEAHIDALVNRARELLGDAGYKAVHAFGKDAILADIREDLAEFGVEYDEWFSEASLTESGAVDRALDKLQGRGHLYKDQGAWWFRSSAFGDEKDRVVRRDNGQITYFASDIAYHLNKLDRGFGTAIDIWGADHHGYVPRVQAALAAFGEDPKRLEVRLVQFAILYRGGERVQMSTRSGSFVTLRELREEVGRDAARFFYVMRKPEQHMDFDLDLAKSQSADNPVYYIQYAHARVCSVLRQMDEKGLTHDPVAGEAALPRLTEAHEQDLLNLLRRYPDVIDKAAAAREPHQLANYLRDLANGLHTYYNAHQFLVEDADLRHARLNLVLATRQVLANGLAILGVSAPQSM
ncbi:arginine--tRNA ligase [Alkalilimnicola sp. S0819]|uniref:arginine--tRNA ligase n=1 Tax=Alkalilimnicola sp. S0819 TaxID=2613922 RepID=UPI00126230C6|nr:arginine--tRNA ligase [Alkalilimnicola sp. S0819]KAB7623986.1 arginine--tRNA ligase [Alkalilimnicola sp. S0819]MPQ16590.1 arginine--tRNA ligase [Alkalilimnicola sp. S0819]